MGRLSLRSTTDDHKSIPVCFLNRHGYFKSSGQIGSMTWSRDGIQTGSIGLRSSMVQGEEHIFFFYTCTDRHGNKTEVDNRIQLTSTLCNFGGRRWWFVCSGCGRRVGVLYLSDKYFSCRRCNNLTYQSCRDSHRFDGLFLGMGLFPKQATSFKRAFSRKR